MDEDVPRVVLLPLVEGVTELRDVLVERFMVEPVVERVVPVVVLGRVYVVPRLVVVLRFTVEVLRPVEVRSVAERTVAASRVPTTLLVVLRVTAPCVRLTAERSVVVRDTERSAEVRVAARFAIRLGLFLSLITLL